MRKVAEEARAATGIATKEVIALTEWTTEPG
jgi:hypothetical protein